MKRIKTHDIIKDIIKDINDDIANLAKYSKKDITNLLKKAIYAYYNTDNPIISDELYDLIVEDFKNHNNINLLGSDTINKVNKVKLDYWMGSINKIKYNTSSLDIWKKKFNNKYIISEKLDGVSALLVYTTNSIKLYTRGNGSYGTDITHLLKYLKNITSIQNILNYCKNNNISGAKNKIAFRGELVMKKNIFEDGWKTCFKNSRNMIAGLVNSKDVNIKVCEDTDLVLYEVVDPIFNFEKQLKLIQSMNFNCVYYIKIDKIEDLTFESLYKILKLRKNLSYYEIDGIIVTTLKEYIRNISGNPEYSLAYKTTDIDGVKTKVIDVTWNVSKDGFLIPVIHIEPININNTIIKKTLGFNAKYIVDNNIGVGTELEIIRSGDVIPYITKIYINNDIKPLLPSIDINWTWHENNIDIILKNNNQNKNYLIKNLYYFFSKLEATGIGIKNIEKIYNKGYTDIIDILNITQEKLLSIDTFKEKTANNILHEINKIKQGTNILDLTVASNKLSHGIGKERIKLIFDMDPYIIDNFNKRGKQYYYDKIINLRGFNEKTAMLVVDSFNAFIDFHKSVKKYIKIIYTYDIKPAEIYQNNFFKDKIFVFTGFTDKILENKINSAGGIVKPTYVKNLDYLIITDNKSLDAPTSKITRAINDKKIILTYLELSKYF